MHLTDTSLKKQATFIGLLYTNKKLKKIELDVSESFALVTNNYSGVPSKFNGII